MRPSQPFRPFFALAALDAIIGVLPWLASGGPPTPEWHRDELLFGMVPAVMAGFLLTALPRWTRTAPISRAGRNALVAFWCAGRLAHAGLPAFAQPLSAGFILTFAAILAHRIAATRKSREYKVVALLIIVGIAPLLPAALSPRVALAGTLGLVAIIAGRIVPALSGAYLALHGHEPAPRLPAPVEYASALALAGALAAWCLAIETHGLAGGLAAAFQSVRLLSWRGWQVARHPGLLALHSAYLCLPAGLTLQTLREAGLDVPGGEAEIHLWSTGAIGLMCLAVMASMIRRQTGRPFTNTASATAALAFGATAVPLRLLAQADAGTWLASAVFCWVAAFSLFLAAFGPVLLRPVAAPRSAQPAIPSGAER
ncbi:NnrS family protein [Bosea thiooxidans]